MPGVYINLLANGETIVGKRTVDDDGNWFIQGNIYESDGTKIPFKRQSGFPVIFLDE